MGEQSHIEWTTHTFNPWEGCTKVSPGCAHCYAEARNIRFAAGANWGPGAPRRRTSDSYWNGPRRWNASEQKAVDEYGPRPARIPPPRVFCASLADWLDDEVPIEWLADLLELIHQTPLLEWQLLTKRPQNWSRRVARALSLDLARIGRKEFNAEYLDWCAAWLNGVAPANVWVGTTVEDQQRANERIPALLSIPAKIRFLSCEPLLSALDLTVWLHPDGRCGECLKLIEVRHTSVSCDCCCEGPEPTSTRKDLIDWIICGGESGRSARPMNPDWARSLRKQCEEAGVAFFFKQWGEWVRDSDILNAAIWSGVETATQLVPYGDSDPTNFRRVYRVGKIRAGRLLDGKEHNAFPDR